ncbi:MAG TPA: isoprenylcysteine carboxylmethyltransferase family protein [Candidatus Binataceae bacterium]|nr:isoprenylcysteine carboxylmethyltransferase family protein [Candidatus Binataceae bacterium]
MDNLTRKALIGLAQLEVLMALVLFIPAGSIRFWQGWVYWALFSISVTAITLYFLRYDPHLIAGRLNAGPWAEQQTNQKIIQAIAAVLFSAVLIFPAFDYRFHWSQVPAAIVIFGDIVSLLALAMIFLVFRENSYAAGTIRVEAEQHVISTGPYRLVRHPMYSAAVILFLATPLALGSAWGLIIAIPLIAALIVRLTDEERYLSVHLPGYDGYRQRVNYRLLPFIW